MITAFLPRCLYLISALTWVILFLPNPVTIFLAACFSSITIPIYRKLRMHSMRWRIKIEKGGRNTKIINLLIYFSRIMPVTLYTLFIISCLLVPVAILALLVSPQAVAGYARLKELQANNFQLPPDIMEYVQKGREILHEYPRLEKIIEDGLANVDTLFSEAVGMLVSQGFGFVGSTMNVLWLIFLFITLTILFSVYSIRIQKVFRRILNIPASLLHSFLKAIHLALKAITLGILFVALIQGALCGIAFAVVGISQPAFWGLLATMVAPIPMVGTGLVWFPLCISLWFSGKTVSAIGLALWGGIFVSAVDNVLRPFFLRQGIEASFFVLILSILCGLAVFGGIGLIAGPVLLAIGMRAYEEAKLYNKNDI